MIKGVVDNFIIIIIVLLTWSLAQGWIPLASRHWLWLGLGLFLIFPHVLRRLKDRITIWYVVYAFIVVGDYMMHGEYYSNLSNILMELASMLWVWILVSRILNKATFVLPQKIVMWSLFVIVATCISTIIADRFIPGVVRLVVMYVNGNKGEMAEPFYAMGVCEYAFPHAVPIIIPGLIFWLRTKGMSTAKKMLVVICLILCLYLIFISGVSTAVIVSILSVVLSFIISTKSMKMTLIRFLVVGLFMAPLLSKSVVADLLRGVETLLPDDNIVNSRVREIAYSLETGSNTGDLGQREEKYDISLNSIWESPIIGTSDKKGIGGHAVLLDRFAALGMIGGVPFVLFIFFLGKFIYSRLDVSARAFYLVGLLCFLIMLSTKNMSNVYTWFYMAVLLPSMLIYVPRKSLQSYKIR